MWGVVKGSKSGDVFVGGSWANSWFRDHGVEVLERFQLAPAEQLLLCRAQRIKRSGIGNGSR